MPPHTTHDTPDAHSPPQQKRRGRKPGILSRAARESQRKMNHSRIEKARRLKINDTLTTLRALVPADFGRDAEDNDALDGVSPLCCHGCTPARSSRSLHRT